MIAQENHRLRLSSSNGHLALKSSKIKGFRAFILLCEVNVMLKVMLGYFFYSKSVMIEIPNYLLRN